MLHYKGGRLSFHTVIFFLNHTNCGQGCLSPPVTELCQQQLAERLFPSTAIEDVRPGKWVVTGWVIILGDKQGGSKCQLGVGALIEKIGECGLQGLNHQLFTRKRDPFSTGLFFVKNCQLYNKSRPIIFFHIPHKTPEIMYLAVFIWL